MKYVMIALVVLIAAVAVIVRAPSDRDVSDRATALYEDWTAVNGPHEGRRLTITSDWVELADGTRTIEAGPLLGIVVIDQELPGGSRKYSIRYGDTDSAASLTVVLTEDGALRLAHRPESRWTPRRELEP